MEENNNFYGESAKQNENTIPSSEESTNVENMVFEEPKFEVLEEAQTMTSFENDADFAAGEYENNFNPPYVSTYNPINFSTVEPQKDVTNAGRGLKIFAFIMIAVFVLTATCATGYFVGKNSSVGIFGGSDVSVGLEAKPKESDELTAAQVYKKVNPSVVGICVYNSQGASANASGVIYSDDGYVVTNDHIYFETAAPKFKIYTYDGKEYDAEYVAGDNISDLAVLKIKNGSFKKAKFGNSDQLIFGESVVAIGRPAGASDASSITKGIVSATSRRVQTTSDYSSRLIETDCPINPGSSGGALVNMYGQVIGITSSKLASADIDAIGYAIPTTTVKRIVEELIKNGKVVTRAKLGIKYKAIDSVAAETQKYDYAGLYIDTVSEDSDLYKKIGKGDIITHINNIEVTSDEIVLDIIEKAKAGDTVTVTFVSKDGKISTVEAILKANVGESSYSDVEEPKKETPVIPEEDEENGDIFDLPFDE